MNEEARLESRWQAELILESITDAYISIDSGWCGVYMNLAAERLLGMPRARVIGRDIRQIYAGTDIAKFFDRFHHVMDRRATVEFDAYYEMAQIWVELRIFPAPDGGIAICQRDISERRRAEEHLHASEEWLRLLNENIQDYAITLLDSEGRFIDWNAGAERMFGYTAAEALGQHSWLIFTPEDRAAGAPELELRTARDEGRAEDERWHLRKDGSRFWVSGVMTAMRNEDGSVRGFAKIARDLTEWRRSDEALRLAYSDLEQRVSERTTDLAGANASLQREMIERARAQAARDEVARQLMIAQEQERERISRELHDQMGQQLTALMLGLRALKDASGRRREQVQAIERLQSIADQIGREVHQLALDLRPTALDDLGLAAALANYADDWGRRSQIEVSFHSHGLDDLRPSPDVETATFRMVLEALNNVARHAQARHVSVIVERQDEQLVAIVEDDGIGFDTDAVLGTLHSQQRLGLLGMQERIAQVGGSFTIEATPGSGTTIIARVPLLLKLEGLADG